MILEKGAADLLCSQFSKGDRMKFSAKKVILCTGLVAIGIAIAAVGLYIGQTDDAPGAGLGGLLLMIGAVVLAVRIARRNP